MLCYSMFQMLLLSTMVQVLLPGSVFAAHKHVKRLSTYKRRCYNHVDCSPPFRCLPSLEACPEGRCVCPEGHVAHVGRCYRARIGLASCDGDKDKCVGKDLHCDNDSKKCKCHGGMRMTSDRLRCFSANQKILGQSCDPKTDKCFQRLDGVYTTLGVYCSEKYARCLCDVKENGNLGCRNFRIGEARCSEDKQCQGGALCGLDGYCVCYPGYREVDGKCIREGATFGLGEGEHCEEVHEEAYCRRGLVCATCHNHPFKDGKGATRCFKRIPRQLLNTQTSSLLPPPSHHTCLLSINILFFYFSFC